MKRTIAKIGILTGLIAALTMALAACGADPTATPRPTATSAPAPATTAPTAMMEPTAMPTAMMEDRPTLIFAGLNWTSAAVQNELARAILENGYGYETDVVEGGTIPLMQALTRGEVNVNMEIWLPNQQAAWDEAVAEGTVEALGDSLAGKAWQSAFIIPQYTADANPGLQSVDDLMQEEYWSLFRRPTSGGKAGLVTCIPGWECEARNEQQVSGYGLGDVIELINPGSFEALNAEIQGAFENEEDLLFYYWAPTALMTKLETQYGGIFRLDEPASTEECEDYLKANREDGNTNDATMACEYADADVLVAVHTSIKDSAADAVAFLERYQLSDEGIGSMLVQISDSGVEPADAVAQWLQSSDEWKDWVPSDIADKVLAGL